MKLLGREYSGGIERLWNDLDPKPCVREYPAIHLRGKDARFAGDHHYVRGVGDVFRIVSDSGNEYVLAHELMHTVLRRNNFPHWTGRVLRANYDAVMGFLGQLESTALHPAINKRLRDYQLDLPIEHANSYVERCVMQLRANEGAEDPIDVAFWSLLFAEMTMWNIETREQLQAKLRLPAAWALADEFLQIARGIETGSPQDCRSFALQAI
jgi:hypothetical protein